MGRIQEQKAYEWEMMATFPAGTRVKVGGQRPGVITTHVSNMQNEAYGVMVRFDNGDASEEFYYWEIEKIA